MLPTIWFCKNQIATAVPDLYLIHPKKNSGEDQDETLGALGKLAELAR